MEERNYFDIVVDELHEVNKLVKDEMARRFRKTNPFRMKPVDNDVVDYIYDNMTPEDMDYAVQTYGDEVVNNFIYEQETRKHRRNKP